MGMDNATRGSYLHPYDTMGMDNAPRRAYLHLYAGVIICFASGTDFPYPSVPVIQKRTVRTGYGFSVPAKRIRQK